VSGNSNRREESKGCREGWGGEVGGGGGGASGGECGGGGVKGGGVGLGVRGEGGWRWRR